MPIHYPIGITVEIVGIEANSNGRSFDQHDVCGSALEDDVVVRLRKVQILNTEESAIAAYLVSDGINQCRVGFLQRHLVRHAKSFDGVLAQVTEVYSVTSESPECLHNMGCCLAAVISAMPPLALSNVNKNAMREDVSDEDHAMKEMLGENNNGSYDAASSSSDKAEDHSISNKAHAPPLCQEGQNKECNHSTPISKKDNPNGNSSKRKTDDLTLAPAALVFTPPPPANTPQRTRAQTKKAGGLMTTPPPLVINEEPHCMLLSTKQSKKSGKKDKPKRKAGDLALPSSGLSASKDKK